MANLCKSAFRFLSGEEFCTLPDLLPAIITMLIRMLLPLVCIMAQYGLSGILMTATTKGSSYQIIGILTLVSLLYIETTHLSSLYNLPLLKVQHLFFSFVRTVHIINLLYIIGIDKHSVVEICPSRSSDIMPRWCFAVGVATSLRGIGTRWEAKNLPAFPRWISLIKGTISRQRFILRQIVIILGQLLTLDILYHGYFDLFFEFQELTHGPGTEYMIHGWPTILQLATRLAIVPTFLLALRTVVDSVYRCMSIASVSLCLARPEDWPPFFGSVWDAYTFRKACG